MKRIVFLITILLVPIAAEAQVFNSDYVAEDSKIFKTITTYDDEENPLASYTFEVTEEQYQNDTIFPEEYMILNFARGNISTHETTYKRLTLSIQPYGVSQNNKMITITNEWLKIPAVKQHDVLGFHIKSGSLQMSVSSSFYAEQKYNGLTYSYSSTSTNRVSKSNGEAIIMNIIDETSTSLVNMMRIQMAGNNANLVINASYQHATTNNITSEEAHTVTFGTTTTNNNKMVLGNTFIFSKTIGSKYDGMAGVSVAYDPYDFG